jgi:hypothetical protein
LLLRTVDVEKRVPPDQLGRAIGELVGQLDLTAFSAEVKVVEGEAGQQRAVREKLEKMKRAGEELPKVQAAPKGKAEPSQRRASETDAEARIMKPRNGGFAPSHKVQISTHTVHGIMVAARVTQDCSDQHPRVPAIAEIQRPTGQAPEPLGVDEGYTTRENILAAADPGVDLTGSGLETQAPSTPRRFPQRGVDPAVDPDPFPYNTASDSDRCPQGQTLPYQPPT